MSYSRDHDYSMYASNPIQQSTKAHMDDNESNPKTMTKFPPISKLKTDQTPNIKQNGKEMTPIGNLNKKTSEQAITNLFKKVNVVKRKGDKKKSKLVEIRPQILQKYKQYLQFTWLVNLTNNLKIQVTEKVPNYVLYVGKGNNSPLIKSIFKTYRPWWTIEQSMDNTNINMYWFQLRQNDILDDFKENMKTEQDFQNCDYYLEDNEQKSELKEKETRSASKSNYKSSQIRSQSVTQKQIKSAIKMGLTKRSSSRTKGGSQQQPINMIHAVSHIRKDLIRDDLEQGEESKKKVLWNPKMWPIYQNYRRLFSQSELKQLKMLKAIQQNGRVNGRMCRNKVKCFENRSNYFKMHNHLTNNWNLSNKKALFINLKDYYQAQKINPFDYIPMTFHVTDLGDKEFTKFQEQYRRRADLIREEQKNQKNPQFKHGVKPKKRNAWLVKPGENTNRGTDIEVVETIEDVQDIIQKDKIDKMGRVRTHIVQEYIMPFLYQRRKFDIRSYICMSSVNGYQKGYWFQDGYIRTACKEFNMKNLSNKFVHLTNDAVQKYHEDYGKFQPANKISFSDFQRYLDSSYNSNVQASHRLRFFQQVYPQMKKLSADAIRSVYTKINPNKKQYSFQIFGLDFLIDQNFKVWLIQCNTNPCLQLACPLLGRVIPSMLQNAFKIVVDTIFPPPPVQELVLLSKKLTLPENAMESNKFELIFDEVEEGKELKSLMSSTPEMKIFQVQEQEQEQYDDDICKNNKEMMVDD